MNSTNLPTWRKQLNSSYVKFAKLSPERAKTELAFALQAFQNNTRLQQCDAQSIFDAIVNIARTNLSLNPITKLAYLIPRKNRCVLEISYVGLVKMLKDDGCIKHISAHVVYEDEDFNYDVPNNTIRHNATYAKTEAEHKARHIMGVYTRAELPSGDVIYDFMATWEIEKIKNVSSFNGKGSVWDTWKLEMYKKTAIKRAFKLLIGNASTNLASVLALEEENNPIKGINNAGRPRLKTAFIEETEDENPFTAFDDIPLDEPKEEEVEVLETTEVTEEPKSRVKEVQEMSQQEIDAEFEKVAKQEQENWNNNKDLFGGE